MSRVTRQKHVFKEMMEDDYELPKANQQIVRIVSSPGNNLHVVESANKDSEHFLVTMPNKFRRNIWVKRGDYILVEPIEEGDKVKAEICKILTREHIKEYTKGNIWPERFALSHNRYMEYDSQDSKDDDDEADSDYDDLEPNMNRPMPTRSINESDDSDEDYDTSSDEDAEK